MKGVSRKIVLIISIQLMGATIVFGQNHSVSGSVTDTQTDDPLPGVNILVVGTSTGASTDAEGHYTLQVKSLQDTLRFSFIGYKTKMVPINGRTTINIELQSQILIGHQLVVTALGVQRQKASLSYSTQEVNTQELKSRSNNTNLIVSLQGKVAGLSITQSGAGVGAPARVILRGNRSVNGNNQPLYVVDGVPTRGQPENLSLENVASINVLKGANAAALYGSKAQNGVIVINTKTPEKNTMFVTLDNKFTFLRPVMRYDYQNVYGQGSDGVYSPHSIQSWGPKMEGQMVDTWSVDPKDAGDKYAFLPQPNNIRDIFQTGYSLTNNLSINVGGETSQSLISFTHTGAAAIIPTHGLKEYDALLKNQTEVNNWITFNGKLNYMNQHRKGIETTGGLVTSTASQNLWNAIYNIHKIPRNIRTQDMKNYSYYDMTGNSKQNFWLPGNSRAMNPYWDIHNIRQPESFERILALGSIRFDFTNALSLLVRASYDGKHKNIKAIVHNGTYHSKNGNFITGNAQAYKLYSDFLLTYKKSNIGKHWGITANLGGSTEKDRNESIEASAGNEQGVPGLVLPNLFSLNNSLNAAANNSYGSPVDINSLYAFADLSWKNSLFLNVSGRNDWSSTLPADSRSYFYPSAGVSAIISSLISSFPEKINLAKLRFSWSKVGNGAPYGSLIRRLSFSPGGISGLLQLNSVLPNKKLKPESTVSYEAGLDLKFLNSRVGLDLTLYKENTLDQLFTVNVPVGSGESAYFTNGGNIQNEGMEMSLSTIPIQMRNFKWNLNINFSSNRNKVISLISNSHVGGNELTIGSQESYLEKLLPGQPYGNIYVIGFQRDNQGRVIVGQNGIPIYTSGRSVLAGHAQPDWTSSLSNTLRYRNISFHFLITYRQGGIILSKTQALLSGLGDLKNTVKGRQGGLIFGKNFFSQYTAVDVNGSPNNIPMKAQDFWRSVGSAAYIVSEPFIEDATNMQMREMDIGYTLTASMLKKIGLSGLSNVRISFMGQNLFYFYRASRAVNAAVRTGTSQSTSGIGGSIRPNIRSLGMDISLKF
jgi:TonB-linked SusC/RagA family outer membrane protein